MKICLLTLPLHANYGGILQAFALQKVLTTLGHEVEHVEKQIYPKSILKWTFPLKLIKRIIFKIFFHGKVRLLQEIYDNRTFPIVTQHTSRFIDKHLKRRFVGEFADLNESDYDAYLVGSDQVWRPHYVPKIESMFFDFTQNWKVKRYAYAASFGSENWEYSNEQTKACKKLVEKFDFVSVREQSGVALVKKHFGIDAKFVLDPTMLLDQSEYESLITNVSKSTEHSSNIVAQYILDAKPELISHLENLAAKHGLSIYRSNSLFEDESADVGKRIQPPVEQWLTSFRDASFVLTDSFHATVFSILFKKPFYVFTNPVRGNSRIESLLTMFGLENRIIRNHIELQEFDKTIDWCLVESRLQEKRMESIKLLKNALA